MGLPKFETQRFESLGSIAPQPFDNHDRYKLFALKIWPLLSGCREELAQCYDQGNGRTGGGTRGVIGSVLRTTASSSPAVFGPRVLIRENPFIGGQ